MYILKTKKTFSFGRFLPGILKTTTMGYDGKGQYPINNINEIESLNIDFDKEYILEKLVKLKKEISVIVTRFNNNKYEIWAMKILIKIKF